MIVSGSGITGDFYFFPYFFYVLNVYNEYISFAQSVEIGLPWWSNG